MDRKRSETLLSLDYEVSEERLVQYYLHMSCFLVRRRLREKNLSLRAVRRLISIGEEKTMGI